MLALCEHEPHTMNAQLRQVRVNEAQEPLLPPHPQVIEDRRLSRLESQYALPDFERHYMFEQLAARLLLQHAQQPALHG